MTVTLVSRTRRFERQLDRVPEFIRVKAIVWIELVERVDIRAVRIRPGFHDEPLQGDRWGERSVRLNRSYRLVYMEVEEHWEIRLLEVTKHEY